MVRSETESVSHGQGIKPPCKQCNIEENHNLKSTHAYDENMWHVNMKPIVISFFTHFTIVVVPIMAIFYCLSSTFVPDHQANPIVPQLTTRDKEHCWWSLLYVTYFRLPRSNSIDRLPFIRLPMLRMTTFLWTGNFSAGNMTFIHVLSSSRNLRLVCSKFQISLVFVT